MTETGKQEPGEQEARQAARNRSLIMGSSFGVTFGVVIGVMTDNIGFWLPIGIIFGTGLGAAGIFARGSNSEA